MYALNRSTDATSEPITLEEAKLYLRVSDSADDEQISVWIKSARNMVEQHTNRQLMTATWDLYLDHFPYSADPILLPKSPVQSITSVTYTDTDGATQTWSSANYAVDIYSEPARLNLAYSVVYPSTRLIANAVRVRYVAGWTTAALVPSPIRVAMLMHIRMHHDGEEEKARQAIFNLLEPYRVGDEFTCYGAESYDTD